MILEGYKSSKMPLTGPHICHVPGVSCNKITMGPHQDPLTNCEQQFIREAEYTNCNARHFKRNVPLMPQEAIPISEDDTYEHLYHEWNGPENVREAISLMETKLATMQAMKGTLKD